MMRRMFFTLAFLLSSVLMWAGQSQTFTNPVIDADYPDCDIIRVENDYYLLSTTMFHFPGATILHSRDMVNWEFWAQPLAHLADTDGYNLLNGKHEYSHGMWASGLKYHDGKFYMLLNAQGLGSFIMTATDLRGEWTMKKLDRTYYDSNFLFDDDGKIYIAYGYNHISMAEVDKDFNYVKSKEVIVRERSGLEGNHIYHIGDYYYLYCTYGGYPSGQAAFRAKSPWGPFEEKMLIEKQIGGKINTVHQGALVQTQTGQWWSMLFEDEGASGRMPHLQPVTWQDGWPMHGDNGVPLKECRYPDVGFPVPQPAAEWQGVSATQMNDDFDSATLSMQWQWNHQPVAGSYSLTERPGWLRLKTVGRSASLKYARGSLTERISGFKSKTEKVATTKMDISKMKDGDVAGLAVFQDPYAYVAVEKKGSQYQVVWREDTVRGNTRLPEVTSESVALPKNVKEIWLQTRVDFGRSEATYYYSLDGVGFNPIGGQHRMTFNLSVFVGARYYLFNFATKRQGGYVDFDYLHCQDNDQRLWYDRPAKAWLEALPLGNSRMGAMVYGGTDIEEIQLNEETFWSGGPHNNNSATSLQHLAEVRNLIFDGKEKEAETIINREFIKGPHGMRYLTAGSLMMHFGHRGVTGYERELDLQTAVSTTSYIYNNVKYTRRVIASLPDGIVAVNVKASEKGALNFTLMHRCQLPFQAVAEGQTLIATIQGVEQEGIPAALTAQCRTDVKTDGTVKAEGSFLRIEGATEATLYIAAATNFVNYHDVTGDAAKKNEQLLAAAETMDFKALQNRHVAAYQKQYNRVRLSLGASPNSQLPTDQRLDGFYGSNDMGMVALLFNYGRYLLISSSQKGGQPANLQGVWNNKLNAPWDSKYTININTEMNYWPAEVCNLPETAEPLFAMLKDLSVTGAETARQMYGCRGWMAHHNTDLWRIAGPVDGATWGMFPNGGGWLATHLWEHYQYTLDRSFLRSYYPIMKGAADFYLDYMVERDGELLVVPSVSPEHGGVGKHSTVCAACTMDNQIVRDVLTQTLAAARLLGEPAAYQQALAEAIAKLPPMKVGQYGQLQEWREDIDDPNDEHRHISHLYGLYPSSQISPYTTPELWKAAGVTLQQRGDQATGWSLGWKTNFWARMLDGNHAFKIISNMLRLLPNEGLERDYPDGRTFPNLFDAHPPFQIDGNFGVTAGIAEMLMQSDPITAAQPAIHLLPALPDAWREGSVSGLKARGGYEVGIVWENGRIAKAEVKSQAGGTLRLRCKDELSAPGLKPTGQHDGVYTYEMAVKAGQTVTLTGK